MPSQKQDEFLRDTISRHQLFSRPIANGVDLRILPLGDSMTYGEGSSTGNGYRLDLENLLTTGNNVHYVGSVKSGTMADNANEGYPGYRIDEIGRQAKNSLPERPNVILLMAGTNDIVQVLDLGDAPSRLGNLIDLVVADCPDAAVLVATLTPLLDPVREANRVTYNAAIPGVVASRANAGKQVMMVDMSGIRANDINTTDGIHPVDNGYALIAEAWYTALAEAGVIGWIKAPVADTLSGSDQIIRDQLSKWQAPIEIAH